MANLRNVHYGAERTRTSGLAFRKRLLYPLSYSPGKQMIPQESRYTSSRVRIRAGETGGEAVIIGTLAALASCMDMGRTVLALPPFGRHNS